MSYGGELTFTLRHSPVTRLPTNDRNNRKGGAFLQMKVTNKSYHYYLMKLISIHRLSYPVKIHTVKIVYNIHLDGIVQKIE